MKSFLNLIPDLVLKFDNKGKVLDHHVGNKNFLEALPDDFFTKNLKDLFPIDVVRKLLNNQNLDRLNIKNTVFEYKINKNVNEKFYEGRLVNGENNEFIIIIRDITKHKLREESLLDNLNFVHILIDSIPNPVFFINAEDIVIGCNIAFEEVAGAKQENIIGNPIKNFISKELTGHLSSKDLDGQKEVQRYECKIKYSDGKEHDIIFHKADFITTTGDVRGKVGTIFDISEQKKMEIELKSAKEASESANQAKSEFLANMSHDLRTPLNGILGYAQILIRDKDLTEKQRDSVKIMYKSGDHLLMMINDILDLSKIEARKMELNPIDFNLPDFLTNIVEITKMPAEQKGISFHFHCSNELPQIVQGDEKRLRQILLNLINNAVKFTEKGSVYFNVEYCNSKVSFYVEDTGIGIPTDKINEIFLPFRQVSDRCKGDGTGLGLAISYSLVKMMKSKLHVKSKVNQGSAFWFKIGLKIIEERSPGKSFEKPKKNIVGYNGRKRYIQINDNDEKNTALLKDTLLPLGFGLIDDVDLDESFETARKYLPDLIFFDINGQKLKELEVVTKIRNEPLLNHTSIIAISTHASKDLKNSCLAAGCNEFVVKPILMNDMLYRIKILLKLEWIFAENMEQESKKVHKKKTIVPPSKNILDKLVRLSMIGDVDDIQKHAKRIIESQGEHRAFGEKLYEMAKNLQVLKIKKFLSEFAKT